MSPDGRMLASGSLDGTTKLWDATIRHERRKLSGRGVVVGFSADSRLIVVHGFRDTKLWDLADGALMGVPLTTFTHRGLDTWADVRGSQPYGVFGQTNGTVELWNLGTMSRVPSWRVSETGVQTAALSPDTRLVATTDEKGDMKLWEIATQREVRTFQK